MKYNLGETTKSKTPLNAGYCFLFGYMHNVNSASFHGGFFCEDLELVGTGSRSRVPLLLKLVIGLQRAGFTV